MGSSKPELVEAVAKSVAWKEHCSFDAVGGITINTNIVSGTTVDIDGQIGLIRCDFTPLNIKTVKVIAMSHQAGLE